MRYFAHQGIDHGSPLEAIVHIISSPPLLLLSVVIIATLVVIVIRRQSEMKTSKVPIKVKER